MMNYSKLLIILSPFITIVVVFVLIALVCIAPFYLLYECFNAVLDYMDKGRLRQAKIKAYELKKRNIYDNF